MIYKTDCRAKRKIYENHLKMGGKNPRGETIYANSLYFTKNNIPWIPVMGEMHYSRIGRSEWEAGILKAKAGGVTVISSYVFWIHFEEFEGRRDFSGNNDLREFVRLCDKHGMYVLLRIGPYCHAEVRNGGFPDWMMKKPYALRENNAEYLKDIRRYYDVIYGQVKGFLYKDGGNIIGVQLDNEVRNDAEHLSALKKIAIEAGFDVPLYSVTGWGFNAGADLPEAEVIPFFGGYPEAPWEPHADELEPSVHYFFHHTRNDGSIGSDLADRTGGAEETRLKHYLYPFAMCELGGGVNSTYRRRPAISGGDVAAISLVKLGSGNNLPGYYMYHSGKNPVGKASTFNETSDAGHPTNCPILNYDFTSPLGVYGQMNESYKLLKIQSLFLNDFGALLAPMESYLPPNKMDIYNKTGLRYAVRTDGEGGFVFVNNYQRLVKMKSHKGVRFSVETSGGTVLFPERGINVGSGAYFILPFNLNMNGILLKYATAQLLARVGDTYFFFNIDGGDSEFVFENAVYKNQRYFETGNIKVVTLTYEEAKNFYKINGKAYISKAGMYFDGNKIRLYGFGGDLSYSVFDGKDFIETKQIVPAEIGAPRYSVGENITVTSPYMSELHLEGEKKLLEAAVKLPCRDGGVWLKISYVGSVAQLYVDGALYDDEFYKGRPWIVKINNPRAEIKLIISELKLSDNIYLETKIKEGLKIEKIEILTAMELSL